MDLDFTEKKNNKVLFIFDVNSITNDKYFSGLPLPLDIFTQLVDTFKDVEVDANTFKYVSNENLIVCDSEMLTIEYMKSLKEKVKVEYAPLTIEKTYEFKGFIRHIDILNSELNFIDKYNVDTNLLCSTFVDYDTKTIIIKSKSAGVKRTISLYASKLIESCVYIINASSSITALLTKYPYRDLIKGMHSTDFVSRTVPVSLPKEDDVKVDYTGKFVDYSFTNNTDSDVVDSIKCIIKDEFTKHENKDYVEVIGIITDEQLREVFEDPDITLLGPKFGDNKVAESQVNESKATSNMYSISDYTPPFGDSLYNKQDDILEFITDMPVTLEEILDETKEYEVFAKIKEAKAKALEEGKPWYSRQDA